MSTSTTTQNEAGKIAEIRESVGRVLEKVREGAAENRPIEGEALHELGEFLATLDDALRQVAAHAAGSASESTHSIDLDIDDAGSIRSASISPFPHLPSPDALFQSRGIVIQYHHQDKGWYAMRERRKAPRGDDGYAPALVLFDDGWDERGAGGKGRKGRMFESEIEARMTAAITPCPGDATSGSADRIAFIIVSDAPHEPEGLLITAHFDQRPDMPVDLVNPQGAHRVAMDALRFIGGATNTARQIERGLVAAGAASDGGGR